MPRQNHLLVRNFVHHHYAKARIFCNKISDIHVIYYKEEHTQTKTFDLSVFISSPSKTSY